MITIYSNEEFYEKYYDVLLENEACQQLILGNLISVMKDPKEGTLFGVISEGSNQYFVCYFPPYSILVTYFPGVKENESCERKVGVELAAYLEEHNTVVRGINAPEYMAESFDEYYSLKNKPMYKNVTMDVMELRSVNEVKLVGELEYASLEELETVTTFYRNFCLDALGEAPSVEDAKKKLSDFISKNVLHVLKVNDEIVSMCCTARKLERGYSINAVYTVPKHRGKGYCKSMIAKLCTRLLSEGSTFACLYVDHSNPISNAAYETVGFKIMSSSCEYLFKE